jgi:hypothetical protein
VRFGVALVFLLVFSPSCATRRAAAAFRVLPASPDYLLRSPDSKNVPFPEVLSQFTEVGSGWVELCPQTELRVENAYFREGAPKHGLANFLGTQIARYQVVATGALEQISVESRVEQPPSDQPPVQQLLSEAQRLRQHHRFFYQVLLSKKSNVRSAVLLGADSTEELDHMTSQLITEPELVCNGVSPQCTVFPEACTVSLEIEILVNGTHQTIAWGSTLLDFAETHERVRLFRPYKDGLAPVEVDSHDHEALRVPLLPGDVVKW